MANFPNTPYSSQNSFPQFLQKSLIIWFDVLHFPQIQISLFLLTLSAILLFLITNCSNYSSNFVPQYGQKLICFISKSVTILFKISISSFINTTIFYRIYHKEFYFMFKVDYYQVGRYLNYYHPLNPSTTII